MFGESLRTDLCFPFLLFSPHVSSLSGSEERAGGFSSVSVRVSRCHSSLAVSVGSARHPSVLYSRTERSRWEKGQEEEGPERTAEARVGVRAVLQGHTGRHQGSESQRHLRRGFQDRRLHVG